MCGIFGLISREDRNDLGVIVASALNQMQHRGDFSAGVASVGRLKHSRADYRKLRTMAVEHAIADFNSFKTVKGKGKVSEVFKGKEQELKDLGGFMSIGQVRYPTAGYTIIPGLEHAGIDKDSIQPLTAMHHKVSMVHNGDIHNFKDLTLYFSDMGLRQSTYNDLEVVLKTFNEKFFSLSERMPNPERVATSVKHVFDRVKGTYSALALINNVGLVAFRDPQGRRPLFFGTQETDGAVTDIAFASETVALEKMLFKGTLDSKYVTGKNAYDEVKPGQMVFVSKDFEMIREQLVESDLRLCPFEAAYFERASSFLNNQRVKKIREEILQNIWDRFKTEHEQAYTSLASDDVIICPVPRTAESAAIYLQNVCAPLGFKYRIAIEKNPSSSRLFMQPTQRHRDVGTIEEHYIYEEEVKGKTVLLIDDSIVRGTTLKHDIKYLRAHQAASIHAFITFPPIINPCMHAIDFHTTSELLASGKDLQQIKQEIGLRPDETINYCTKEDLSKALGLPVNNLCDECYR